ncbi:Calmodulin and related proteins (EF-Hand superfamily) [Handroanthus impetiginosus]|uniref:Calmodulin and related proteins (EF-Hand superfamily) n=1 Tax=Handroanthus impetiginosus TaxID=429701 RepID=A0A2G9I389_9LAMI|nr:Calmodulin and related proteins (EF-Hand superfamily) [Handroanthus impetiginosus]
MELTLANIISNFLVLGFKSLTWDIENFVSSVHFVLLTIFSTIWESLWTKLMQVLNTSGDESCNKETFGLPNTSGDESCNKETFGEPNTSGDESCNKETLGSEKRISISAGEINLIMSRMGIVGELEDNTGNKSLSEEDFMGLFDEEEPSLEEIKETFGVFDVNKDGFIDASELQRVLCSLGLKEGCILEDCRRMIKAFDCNGDGLIDCKEFVKLMEKCLC